MLKRLRWFWPEPESRTHDVRQRKDDWLCVVWVAEDTPCHVEAGSLQTKADIKEVVDLTDNIHEAPRGVTPFHVGEIPNPLQQKLNL